MPKKKILATASHRGGANAIAPVLKELSKDPHLELVVAGTEETCAEHAAQSAGLPAESIVITGNPHFDSFPSLAKTIAQRRKAIRVALGVHEDAYLILYASDTTADLESKGWGFSNADVVETICAGISQLDEKTKDHVALYIRSHPSEPPELAATLPSIALKAKVHYTIAPYKNGGEVAAVSDLVVAAASTMLLEALLLGVNAVSLQPGRKGEDAFVLNVRDFIPHAYTKEDGARTVRDAIVRGRAHYQDRRAAFLQEPFADGKATERVVRLVYEMLDRKGTS
jgi:UDP-N-acetylglucosamine 2-epimerase